MERIKQALDKARAESSTQAADADKPRARSAHPAASSDEGEINVEYSQTKVQAFDAAKARENRIVVGNDDRVALGAYKMLRTQIMQRMTAKGWNALAVTSPAPNDGKTVTAINLAISLARELHHTVLLVDMDLPNPNVHKYFAIEATHGIADYLLHSVPMNDVLVNPGIDRLVILPGCNPVPNSSELLASPMMGKLVQELKSRYPSRIIIFDLPPVLSADDALSFAPFVDAFLLVLRDGKTTKAEVERVIEILTDVPIIGTVLNASSDKIAAYY